MESPVPVGNPCSLPLPALGLPYRSGAVKKAAWRCIGLPYHTRCSRGRGLQLDAISKAATAFVNLTRERYLCEAFVNSPQLS